MELTQPPRIGRRALLKAPAALSVGLVHVSPHPAVARQASPSLTLLVRGETTLTGSPMTWRVVSDVAEVSDAAAFERRSLGFAVAPNPFNSLLLTDEATGSAYRLAPSVAAFVRDGTMQPRESLADSPESYLCLALEEPSAAADAGGDRLIFAGPVFLTTDGVARLVLFRVNLETGSVFHLPPRTGKALVLVEQGEADLEEGGAAPRDHLLTAVGSDTLYAVRSVGGEAMLNGAREATSVLMATID